MLRSARAGTFACLPVPEPPPAPAPHPQARGAHFSSKRLAPGTCPVTGAARRQGAGRPRGLCLGPAHAAGLGMPGLPWQRERQLLRRMTEGPSRPSSLRCLVKRQCRVRARRPSARRQGRCSGTALRRGSLAPSLPGVEVPGRSSSSGLRLSGLRRPSPRSRRRLRAANPPRARPWPRSPGADAAWKAALFPVHW